MPAQHRNSAGPMTHVSWVYDILADHGDKRAAEGIPQTFFTTQLQLFVADPYTRMPKCCCTLPHADIPIILCRSHVFHILAWIQVYIGLHLADIL